MNKQDILDILCSRKVIIIAGEYGRGKTLSATALCFLLAFMNSSFRILSNIPLNFKTELFKVFPLIETKTFDIDNKNTIIFIDEMQRDFNSKEFMSSSAKIVSKFAVDFRKDDQILIGTLQFVDRLDLSLNEMVQIIIIPSFVNKYSNNEKEDNKIRLENKDFIVIWKIIDKKYDEVYELKINLYPFLNMYDTKFKPMLMVINHSEFIEKQKNKLSKSKFEELELRNTEKVKSVMKNWRNL